MSAATKKFNIVWVSYEDVSPRFGCYGDRIAQTPHTDRLAAEGVLFQHAYSTAGVCSPSRCAVITGMYAPSIGAQHHRTSTPVPGSGMPPYEAVPPAYVRLLPEYLRAQGYYCSNNGGADYQFAPPFTAWDEVSSKAHWRNRESGQPFFSVFNLGCTHESGMWRFEGETATSPASVEVPPYLPDTLKSRQAIARHYDHIHQADAQLGQLLRQLEEDGLMEDTFVFIWSDHGDGIPRSKRWLYDSGIHVPFIIKYAGRYGADSPVPGTISEQLVSLIDLAPTVLSLLGMSVPSHMQGQPLIGTKAQKREYIYASRDRHGIGYDMVRAVRDNRFKYIRNYYPDKHYFDWVPYGHHHPILQEMWRLHAAGQLEGPQKKWMGDGRPPEELYDCIADPHETHNLAEMEEYRPVRDRLRNQLAHWRKDIEDKGDIPELQWVHQIWPGGVQPQTASVEFVAINERHPGHDSVTKPDHYSGPLLVMLYSATQGASIAYNIVSDSGESSSRWQLYVSPLRLSAGKHCIQAKAVRIGYKSSEETEMLFTVVN